MLAAHSSLRCELPLGRSAAMCRSQQPKALDPRPLKEKAQDPRRLLNFGAGNFCRCSRVCPLVRFDKRGRFVQGERRGVSRAKSVRTSPFPSVPAPHVGQARAARKCPLVHARSLCEPISSSSTTSPRRLLMATSL